MCMGKEDIHAGARGCTGVQKSEAGLIMGTGFPGWRTGWSWGEQKEKKNKWKLNTWVGCLFAEQIGYMLLKKKWLGHMWATGGRKEQSGLQRERPTEQAPRATRLGSWALVARHVAVGLLPSLASLGFHCWACYGFELVSTLGLGPYPIKITKIKR